MSGKMLIFLGLLVSALFMYLCIDSKKDAFYAQLNGEKEVVPVALTDVTVPKESIEPVKIVAETKSPSFAYVSGEKVKIAGFLSTKDKDAKVMKQIDALCQGSDCIKEIKFFDEVSPFSLGEETFALIDFSKKEKIKDFALYLDQESLKIEGELNTQAQKEHIQPLINSFAKHGYTLSDIMTIKKPIPVVKKEETKVETPKEELVTPTHLSHAEAAEKINSIIRDNTITFDYRSSTISKESKKTLDEVIDILFGLDNVTIEVAGYTDTKGDAIYNKVLSQKRADAVGAYLVHSGIREKLIKSVGYGEENPISDPKDIVNRRVEIHLKEGE
jgi:outer membrane protein OmpA-like peptidoglycan-associated protein